MTVYDLLYKEGVTDGPLYNAIDILVSENAKQRVALGVLLRFFDSMPNDHNIYCVNAHEVDDLINTIKTAL